MSVSRNERYICSSGLILWTTVASFMKPLGANFELARHRYQDIGNCIMGAAIRQRSTTGSKRRRPGNAVNPSRAGLFTTVLATVLVAGLVLTVVDTFYILNYVLVRNPTTSRKGNNNDRGDDRKLLLDMLLRKSLNISSAHSGDLPTMVANSTSYAGKEHFVKLLQDAGFGEFIPLVIGNLPNWSDVTALYGDKPIIVGLKHCTEFKSRGEPSDHMIGTAGAFNSGTNLMADLLVTNCHMPERVKKYHSPGVRWQVPWGKHTPVDDENYRQLHRTEGYKNDNLTSDNFFPVVTIRDPFIWMQSMCRHPYEVYWAYDETHPEKSHCPNLVPNQVDIANYPYLKGMPSIPVEIRYSPGVTRNHKSLVGYWNDWYNQYLSAPFPKVFVRFEDLIFYPKEVTEIVCECAGGALKNQPFHYVVQSAKRGQAHGDDRTNFIEALMKYGTEQGRYKGLLSPDLVYASDHLDPRLMKMFGYHYPSV